MNIILKSDIEIVKNTYTDYTSAVILGKGPTLKNFSIDNHRDNFIIGINDVINIIECNMFVANDLETYERINLKKIHTIKYILSPKFPHVNEKVSINTTYKSIISIIKNYYNNYFIPFNLRSGPKDQNLISLKSFLTSSNTAVDFIESFMPNIQKVFLYGVAIHGQDKYHEAFDRTGGYYVYNNAHLSNIRTNIIKSLVGKEVIFK